MPNYFENPTAGFKQYRSGLTGVMTEHGVYSYPAQLTGLAYDHEGGAEGDKEITGSAGDFSLAIVGNQLYVTGTNVTSGTCTVATINSDASIVTVTGLTSTGDNADTTVDLADIEVPTYLSDILAAYICPAEVRDAAEVINCDLTVTSGKVTATRISALTSALTFNYLFLGLT